MKIIEAFKAFFAVLSGKTEEIASSSAKTKSVMDKTQVIQRVERKPSAAKVEPDPARLKKEFEDGALYTLSLLQREGRLIDFLKENISQYDDAQIGAAVREIHASCAKAIDEHFKVEPVISGVAEGAEFNVQPGFNPSELKLTGNVPEGTAPGKGVLAHKGWRASDVKLPVRSGATDSKVVFQAEISY